MKRLVLPVRPDWQTKAESQGYTWHSENGTCSWNEGAAYALTKAEVHNLRATANELYALYLHAAEQVVRQNWWHRLGVPESQGPLLRTSFESGDACLAARFDLMLNEAGDLKLIEFNADVALTLIETSIVQREWLHEVRPTHEQFNDLHASLHDAWRKLGVRHVHLAWRPRHREIENTIRYMASIVREAGVKASLMALHCLGWDAKQRAFVDSDGEAIRCCYKLYPWAWMLNEDFARRLPAAGCRFIEPTWSHLMASKGMLAVLWELFPDHPALLPCFEDDTRFKESSFVSKPLFGREGQNITMRSQNAVLQQSGGDFEHEPCIHQAMCVSPRLDGFIPQFGVWMIHGHATALGIRETDSFIINADSPFTPHFIEKDTSLRQEELNAARPWNED
jgi:glutathionylspermidine synthase